MDVNLKLLAGLPIEVDDIGEIYPLKLRDIACIGDKKYYHYLNLCVVSEEELVEKDNTLEGLSVFEILTVYCFYDKNLKDNLLTSLSLFFNENVSLGEEGVFYLGNINENRIINEANFKLIQEILRKQNCISKPEIEEYKPANDKARELIEKIKQNKKELENIKKSKESNLKTIISSVAWKSHIGINNVWDLTIYQLYDAYQRLLVIDNYDKVMYGIYTGNVDTKTINFKDLDWSNTIKI